MFRILTAGISELSAVAFAIYLAVFFFNEPTFQPALETIMVQTFVFCGICAGYWWLQSGSLAIAGVSSSLRMATDILASILPLLVVGYALIDFWRGSLPLSDFKQYAAYFALAIIFMDVTFNAMIMSRLSRRYLGEVGGL
jgi:hypothetical protein